ncbi:Predicted phosphohydrolase or phosphomutase, AlkP superfamily [Halogranum gelatinilyticum]|uniref:Predicted phosphohydrolase or phosphomutase, AlkP superfamily n=1 Tax=Halogranum gelatinilyticum TaxID=660521 RepID=A0A1G9UN25_9EURY|nr:alkaline phosphatase family protein [Halogranum gelatinilyticum]SDM61318.1 Predicted phosphohydrolase or phosphomutase, AlkP superfamily [Halogranum gelatinilyticum]
MTRLLTLGLDGAAWHKLDRMMDEGKLPNLSRLVAEGSRAPLQTVVPPVTCPAWRCSTSGKNPGKLGVYWWLNLDRESGRITAPDARSFDTADTWDYLSEAGKRCAVLNVPMTYPPSPLNGTMVSGFGAPFEVALDDEPMTYPPEVQSLLEEQYGWQVGVDDVHASSGVDDALDLIRSRFDLLLDLLEEGYDYIHLTVFYINVLQHQFGDGPETERGWMLIDEYLGKLPDDLTKIVYSDHGHSHIEHTFVLNKYLLDEGHLSIERRTGDDISGGLYTLLKRVGLSPRTVGAVARTVLPTALYERLVASGYPIPTFELANRVQWDESDAVALSQGPLYINRDRLGDDYERFRDELKAELEAIRVDGACPFAAVNYAEDVYEGPHLDEAPDLLLTAADSWEIYGGVTPSVVERQVTSWTSGNHPVGVLLVHGPDVTAGELPMQSILDVAPTVLRYLDCPVPTDMDGVAFAEPFRDGLPETGTREPLEAYGGRETKDTDELERRLEDLGYLE